MSNGWFTRKKITGGKGLGLVPASLLVFVPFAIVGLVMWKSPFGNAEDVAGGKKPTPADGAGVVDVRGIASGATSFSGVKDQAREKSAIETSDRDREKEKTTPSDQVSAPTTKSAAEEASDALSLAIAEPIEPVKSKDSPNKKLAGEEGVPASRFDEAGVAEGASTGNAGGSAPISEQLGIATGTGLGKDAEHINPAELVVYRAAKLVEPGKTSAKPATKAAVVEKLILPRGHEIRVYFLQTVNSLDMESMVTLGVAENVVFNHKVVIPFGTRMLGRASSKTVRDRLAIDVDTLIFPDGREVGISALMKDLDGQSGVLGYYIPRPALAQLSPYLSGFAQAYMGTLLERKTSVQVLGSGVTTEASGPRNAFMEESAKMITEQVKQTQDEIMERNKPYVVIVAGSEGMVQLRTRLDLTEDSAATGAKARDIPPGFENTPYRSDGSLQQQANSVLNSARNIVKAAAPMATQMTQQVAAGAESR